jgi:hypothetical protein
MKLHSRFNVEQLYLVNFFLIHNYFLIHIFLDLVNYKIFT